MRSHCVQDPQVVELVKAAFLLDVDVPAMHVHASTLVTQKHGTQNVSARLNASAFHSEMTKPVTWGSRRNSCRSQATALHCEKGFQRSAFVGLERADASYKTLARRPCLQPRLQH